MEPVTHFVITAVVAGAAAAYVTTKRPRWAGATVFLAIIAVIWGMYAVLTIALDDVVWHLDRLRLRIQP